MSEYNDAEDMLDIFLYETAKLIEDLQEIVLENRDVEKFDEASVNGIFRIMHTLKGSSAIMMYDNITKIAHKLEDVFCYIRDSRLENMPHSELVALIFDVLDFVTDEMDKIEGGESPDGDPADIMDNIDKFIVKYSDVVIEDEKEISNEEDEEETQQFYIAPMSTNHSRYFHIVIKYEQSTEMSNLRAYTAVISLKDAADSLVYHPQDIISNDESGDIILKNGFNVLLQTTKTQDEIFKLIDHSLCVESVDITEITSSEFVKGFDFITTPDENVKDYDMQFDTKTTRRTGKKMPAPGDYVIQKNGLDKNKHNNEHNNEHKLGLHKQNYISVSIDKMNKIMDLVGELVTAQTIAFQNADLQDLGMDPSSCRKAASQLTKISSELQEAIMSMRMVSLKNTFNKMDRIVFDVSRKLGKEIELEIVGEDTEVDKNIIEHISDPLMHLIRNSVDHGIEMPDERVAAGKNRRGKIILMAKNRGGKVLISVKDDGIGLNREKILEKAQKNGFLEGVNPDKLTDEEVYKFITYAGLSTNEIVTEYSGRGVGMDVVVKNIQSIGGTLEIDSAEGEGAVMTMKIPLTLAIINGIVMSVGSSKFVVDTGVVKEYINVNPEMISKNSQGKEFISLREKNFPLIRLKEFFELSDGCDKIEDGIVIVLEYESRVIGLFVDWLVGQQEIVVKPVPSYIKKSQGLSGCTQLGDGSIALIIDAGGLFK